MADIEVRVIPRARRDEIAGERETGFCRSPRRPTGCPT
jgi:hypothetical protein